MKAYQGYYCLIQYCPNPGRAEVANVGALVFCPSLRRIDAQLSKNNRRVRRVFGSKSFDPWWLNHAKRSFLASLRADQEQFKSLDDLEQFVTTRGNELVLTKPRSMRVEDVSRDLKRLYAELVEPVPADLAYEETTALPRLEAMFRRLAQERESVKISYVFNVPEYTHRVRADYVYENGVSNLVRVLALRGNIRSLTRSAVQLGGESIFVDRHLKPAGKDAKLIVVAGAQTPTPASETEDLLEKLFRDYPAELVRSREVDDFIRTVEEQAH